jgi:tripartite-type tricarboxylate transporter receptor subunit TctC
MNYCREVAVKCCAKLAALAIASSLPSAAALAQGEYFAGKTVRMIVGSPPGGGYDLYGRFFARHLTSFLPGAPTIVVQNMPGGAGVIFANWLYSTAPRDGTAIGLAPGSLSTAALFGSKGPRYNAREFLWMGSMSSDVAVALSWHTSPVKKAEDLRTQELIVGSVGALNNSTVYPNIMNRILNTRFKVIQGYQGTSGVALALERGEIQGIGSFSYSSLKATRPDWIAKQQINILIQLGPESHPELEGVPNILQLAESGKAQDFLKLAFGQLAIGRPIMGPPGLEKEVAALLMNAFVKMMADPEVIANAERQKMELQPMSGAAVTRLIDDLHSFDPALVAEVAAAMLGQ